MMDKVPDDRGATMRPRKIKIPLADESTVSGLLGSVPKPVAGYIFAHGAGAGMDHSFMEAVARGFAERGIATLRYQFPYMENGSRRPDPPGIARATVRAAVDAASKLMPSIPLFAGGKSFGGRMTSQAQAEEPLLGVRGLLFFGFPLHPAGKPSTDRAKHLAGIKVPMLFLQGTKDTLAEMDLLEPTVKEVGGTLCAFDGADHSFHVPRRSGRTDEQVMIELLDAAANWMRVTV
jgi:predicted alpha/beta-hydrolase family hydrolase